jgi:hypothetical protein
MTTETTKLDIKDRVVRRRDRVTLALIGNLEIEDSENLGMVS